MTQYVTKYKGYPIRDAEAREQLNNIANKTVVENGKLYLVRKDGTKIDTGTTLLTGGSGSDGREIELQKSTDYIQWRYVGDSKWNNLIALSDLKGANGRGITKIEKTATSGLTDTYTITYTDNTTSTFTVKNGADGEEGIGIQSVTKTATNGLVDTYTITRTDGTIAGTFTVTNGAKGNKGDTGATPNLTIGTVETLASGENATASITGTTENPLLNLGIPRGADGSGSSSSGSSEKWKLIQDITLTEDVNKIDITTDKNGNSFLLKEFYIVTKFVNTPSGNSSITVSNGSKKAELIVGHSNTISGYHGYFIGQRYKIDKISNNGIHMLLTNIVSSVGFKVDFDDFDKISLYCNASTDVFQSGGTVEVYGR